MMITLKKKEEKLGFCLIPILLSPILVFTTLKYTCMMYLFSGCLIFNNM